MNALPLESRYTSNHRIDLFAEQFFRHILTKFLSGDGNFKLVHEAGGSKRDPEDLSLTNGDSYFCKWEDFNNYLSDVNKQPAEPEVR